MADNDPEFDSLALHIVDVEPVLFGRVERQEVRRDYLYQRMVIFRLRRGAKNNRTNLSL